MKSTLTQGQFKEGRSNQWELAQLLRQIRECLNATFQAVESLRTTDATPSVIWSSEMPPQSAWTLCAHVIAYSQAGNAASYARVQRYKFSGAAPALLSSAAPVADYEDVAGWNIAFGVVGTQVQLLVSGAVAETIDWTARIGINEAPQPS